MGNAAALALAPISRLVALRHLPWLVRLVAGLASMKVLLSALIQPAPFRCCQAPIAMVKAMTQPLRKLFATSLASISRPLKLSMVILTEQLLAWAHMAHVHLPLAEQRYQKPWTR